MDSHATPSPVRRGLHFIALIHDRFKPLALYCLLVLFADEAVAEDARFFRISGPSATQILEFRPDGTLVWINALAGTNYTVQTASTLPGDTNWVDYVQLPATNQTLTNRIVDFHPPSDMAFIPSGSFTMGDSFTEEDLDERPTHTVYVSAFYMDCYEMPNALWDSVKIWSASYGYSFDYADSGQGKAPTHPTQAVTWYDAVKWCNARSQKEGLVPCYYTDAGLTAIYKTGQVAPYVNWRAGGYRLPTEAEWEKAARGGASGHRFPWSDTDTIQHSRANYLAAPSSSYDVNPTQGYHPTFATGDYPYTSPVGYFTPNVYGLYDMAGNVWEWCWDRYGVYSGNPQTDPRGPTSGSARVYRGGSWNYTATFCRTSFRYDVTPSFRHFTVGFRCVRAADQ